MSFVEEFYPVIMNGSYPIDLEPQHPMKLSLNNSTITTFDQLRFEGSCRRNYK